MTVTYVGPSVASAFVAGTFNIAWELANQKDAEAKLAYEKLLALNLPPTNAPMAGNIDPSKYVAVDQALDSNDSDDDAESLAISERLKEARANAIIDIADLAREFLDEFFGDDLINSNYDLATQWMQDVIQGAMGLPAFEPIFTRARARIAAVADAAKSAVNRTYGHLIPAKAAAYRGYEVASLKTVMLSNSDLDKTSKGFEISVEMRQFAVQRAMKLRSDALDALRNYLSSVLGAPFDYASKIEERAFDEREAFTKAYFGFVTDELKLRDVPIDAYLAQHASNMTRWRDKEGLKQRIVEERVKSMTARIKGLTQQSAAAINSLHGTVSGSASESF
jgi:hypothetical protein